MENSVHYGKDLYGYKYSNQINNYDADIVVFGCEPPLIFDVKAHALKIKKLENSDYDLVYEIRDGVLYLSRLEFYIMWAKLWVQSLAVLIRTSDAVPMPSALFT